MRSSGILSWRWSSIARVDGDVLMAVLSTPRAGFGVTFFSEFLQRPIVRQDQEPGATHAGLTEGQRRKRHGHCRFVPRRSQLRRRQQDFHPRAGIEGPGASPRDGGSPARTHGRFQGEGGVHNRVDRTVERVRGEGAVPDRIYRIAVRVQAKRQPRIDG